MTMPVALPEWLPWWVLLLVLLPVLLYLAMFALMPFSVFGVKGRLDLIDARLDEIQGEIRSLTLRLPAVSDRPPPHHDDPPARPPIPPRPVDELPRRPAPRTVDDDDEGDQADDLPRRLRGPGGRSEPRLDWPR